MGMSGVASTRTSPAACLTAPDLAYRAAPPSHQPGSSSVCRTRSYPTYLTDSSPTGQLHPPPTRQLLLVHRPPVEEPGLAGRQGFAPKPILRDRTQLRCETSAATAAADVAEVVIAAVAVVAAAVPMAVAEAAVSMTVAEAAAAAEMW